MYNKEDLLDEDVKRLRVQNNLNHWEIYMTKYPGLKYNKGVSQFIKRTIDVTGSVRLILKQGDPKTNERRAYHIAKHLINGGVSPSNVCITNIEDCYLSVRGFGDSADIKDKIFRSTNQLIIIENMREIRPTDIRENVNSFWQEFWAYCRRNRNLHVLLPFDTKWENVDGIIKVEEVGDWYPRAINKAPHKELGFTYLHVGERKLKNE